MRLHRLKLVNFRQHVDTEITLGPGITAVIGSNGAGKSTLLEAIAWAMYGAPAARGSRDFIRYNRAAPRAPVRVELDFGLGAHEYRVVRGLYQAELFQDGADRPVANSQQEVTNRLQRLLGMSRDEFFNTYFTGQKELAVMAAMGTVERARFLSRVLGYERLQRAQAAVREQRSRLRGEETGLAQGLADEAALQAERRAAGERLDQAKRRVQGAEQVRHEAERRLAQEGPAWSRMAQLRESVMSLDGERRLAEQRVQEARREFERLDRELVAALEAQKKLVELAPRLARAGALKEELARLDRDAQAAGRRRDLTGQLREVGSQIDRTNTRLAAFRDAPQELARSEADLARAQGEAKQAQDAEDKARTAWVRDKQDAETKRQSLLDQHKELKAHREGILQAGPDGTCPTCLRPLGQEYEAVLGTLARQLEEIEINGRYYRQRLEQLAVVPDELKEAEARAGEAARRVEELLQQAAGARERVRDREELGRELARLTERKGVLEREIAALPDRYDADRHDVVRIELKELEPIVTQGTRLRVQADRAERLVSEAEAADKVMTERESLHRQLVEAIAAAGFSEEGFAAARERYQAAERALREAELDLATVKGDVRAAEEHVARAQRQLAERAELAARLAELRREFQLHDELDRAFGDLRTELNAQMRPELSEIASQLLGELTEGRYHELELDEEYRILVMEDGLPKPVISGGEEDVANLVLRLAISQMVADRAGQPLSLLVLDEVFGTLDEGRREHVLALLRHLGDRFPQVVLITHIEAVREGVDRVLRVTFDPDRGAAVVSEDQGAPLDDVAA